ncbi:MAG: UDP-3-O-(3-hydroxymyristoyl)glucosamine N-acyltransferase [Planctomycetota bacterium]|nr:UDP-3-O-(3-hydroxymyristoyl)glucosamine N-acyltransferase [Planctomycetota bacterium]
MTLRLSQISEIVGGKIVGDPDLLVDGANPPGEASESEITLLDDTKQKHLIVDSKATVVVTREQVDLPGVSQVLVANPHLAFAKLVSFFRPPVDGEVPGSGTDATAEIDPTATIHPSAVIAAGVKIGPGCRVMPGVVIMPRCEIGSDCVLHSGVTLYEYTRLGDRVVVHAGAILGAHGFGYRQHEGRHLPTAQLGFVQIENDVEIGASTTIDRGTYGSTRVGEGTKIDNQVMIAHNCQIGRHNLICSQVGIAGSCRTGDYVVLAGQVGLKDHVHLGNQTIVGAQAGVMENCEGNQVLLGSPATNQREQMQIMAVERRLPEMRRELRKLQQEVESQRQQLGELAEGRKAA